MKKVIKKEDKPIENKEVVAILKANNTEYIGKGETIAKALQSIVIKLIYAGGTLDVQVGDKSAHKEIHVMQMKRLFGINKTTIKLYAKQIEKSLK